MSESTNGLIVTINKSKWESGRIRFTLVLKLLRNPVNLLP